MPKPEKPEVIEAEVITDSFNSKNTKNQNQANISDKEKSVCALGYLLFFLPLIFYFKSPFARHHANQSLLLTVFVLLVNILSLIPLLGSFVLAPLGNLLALFLFIYGVASALMRKKSRLPIIGVWDII